MFTATAEDKARYGEDEFGLGEILAFAILSAVVASVASVLARQVAKKWYKPVPKEDRVAFHNA